MFSSLRPRSFCVRWSVIAPSHFLSAEGTPRPRSVACTRRLPLGPEEGESAGESKPATLAHSSDGYREQGSSLQAEADSQRCVVIDIARRAPVQRHASACLFSRIEHVYSSPAMNKVGYV